MSKRDHGSQIGEKDFSMTYGVILNSINRDVFKDSKALCLKKRGHTRRDFILT
jgi:hypothetical protein